MKNSNLKMISLGYITQTNLLLHDIDVLLLVEQVQGGEQVPEVGNLNEPSTLLIQLLQNDKTKYIGHPVQYITPYYPYLSGRHMFQTGLIRRFSKSEKEKKPLLSSYPEFFSSPLEQLINT